MVTDERVIDLEGVRADGWYEQLVESVPSLEKLSTSLGDVLLALSLAAGFRIQTANTDRLTGALAELQWSFQPPIDIPDASDSHGDALISRGTVATLRAAILATLVGEAEPSVHSLRSNEPSDIRAFLGLRSVLLAPLFGLTLRELRLAHDKTEEPRLVIAHDAVEEVVALKQFRRFLRQRVVEILQGDSGRGQVAIDLNQADLARAALEQNRPEETVARLMSWVGPLTMFHRTAEGQALEPVTRAKLARALGALATAYGRLERRDEQQETMRLALQYAHDGDAASELYFNLGVSLLEETRFAEAIAPLRRALSLGAAPSKILPKLSVAFARSGRAVAGVGCLLRAKLLQSDPAAIGEAEHVLRLALGPSYTTLNEWMTAHPAVDQETTEIPKLPPSM